MPDARRRLDVYKRQVHGLADDDFAVEVGACAEDDCLGAVFFMEFGRDADAFAVFDDDVQDVYKRQEQISTITGCVMEEVDAWRNRPLQSFYPRSEEHTSELQSHSEISYAVFCLKKTIQPQLYCVGTTVFVAFGAT